MMAPSSMGDGSWKEGIAPKILWFCWIYLQRKVHFFVPYKDLVNTRTRVLERISYRGSKTLSMLLNSGLSVTAKGIFICFCSSIALKLLGLYLDLNASCCLSCERDLWMITCNGNLSSSFFQFLLKHCYAFISDEMPWFS